MEVEEERSGAETSFLAYERPLKNVTEFKYMECTLTVADDDWLLVVDNIRKSGKKWAQL